MASNTRRLAHLGPREASSILGRMSTGHWRAITPVPLGMVGSLTGRWDVPRPDHAARVGRAGDRRLARRVGAHLDPRAGSAVEAGPPVCDQLAGEVQEHAGAPVHVPAGGAGPPVGIPD